MGQKFQSEWDAPQPASIPAGNKGFANNPDFTMIRFCDNGADLDVASGTFSNQYDRRIDQDVG